MLRVLMSVLFALSLLAAGCAHAEEGGNALAGTSWRLTGWSASSLDPAPFTITAAFEGSRISGRAAVNSYGGACTATAGGGFSIGELQSTLMAGSEEAMRAEQIYFELLGQARKYTVSETTLTLLDGGGNASLVFTKP